jgi:hypothetical protein
MKPLRFAAAVVVTLATLLGVAATPAQAADQAIVLRNAATGRCLDASSNGYGLNGTPIQLWDCYPPTQYNEMWYQHLFQTSQYGSVYQLRSVAGGRCIDIPNWNAQNGVQLQLWDCGDVTVLAQLWWIYRNSSTGAYTIQSVLNPRLVIDADYWSLGGNGTKVQVWDNYGDGQMNQRWTRTVGF